MVSRHLVVTLAATAVLGCTPRVRHSGPELHATIVRGDVGARLDRYLTRAAAFGFSGAVLVADSGGIVLRKGYGAADSGGTTPIRPDMLFDMGSMVKQFTAAAVLLLESEGKLSTSDSLKKFFPHAPAEKANITLHQLLTHTAGVTDNLSGDYADVDRDSALAVVWNTALLSPPGERFNYSNAGFSMLAAIVEDVTGQPYEQFMRERIFARAGMRETGYHLPGLDTSRVPHTFTPPVDHGDPATRLARARGPSWNLMGNGGMLTTVTDLYQYELALRRGRPVSHAIQRRQFAEQFRRSPTLANGYDWWIEPAEEGAGAIHYNRGGDAPSLGLNTEYRRYPKDSSVFILLANSRHHGASTRRFLMPNLRRIYLGTASLDPPATARASSVQLAPLSGTYRLDSASYFVLRPASGRFILEAFGQRAVNTVVFNRDTTSIRGRERANERMVATIQALAAQDSAAARVALGGAGRASRLLGAWRDAEAQYGMFRCVQLLGTDRLDRGVFQTTARLVFADSVKVVRSVWNGPIPQVNSDDAALVNNFGFAIDAPVHAGAWSPYWWLTGSDSLVTYDLLTNQTLRGWVSGAADGSARTLVLDVPGGTVRAVHTNEEAALPCPPPRQARPDAAAIARAVDSVAATAVAEGFVPALGVAITMDGRIIYAKSHGSADVSAGVPADDRTLWYVASTSKSFTGFGVALLSHRGALRLDAPITALLPNARWHPAARAESLTLAHFLSHTHRLNDDAVVMSAAFTGAIPEARWPSLIALAGPQATDDLIYSNFGYNVAAMVIDRLRPEGWRRYLEREVYLPAGMRETYARVSGLDPRRIAKPHTVRADGRYVTQPFYKTDATMNSAGGHLATLHDLARWTIVQMDSGMIDGRRVFPAEAVALSHRLIARQTRAQAKRFAFFDREGWGAGWDIGTYQGERMVSRFGSYHTTRSHLSLLPGRRIGAVVMASGGITQVTDIIAAFAYDLEAGRADAHARVAERIAEVRRRWPDVKRSVATQDSVRATRQRQPLDRPVRDFVGEYEEPSYGRITFTLVDGALAFRWGALYGPVEILDAAKHQMRFELAGSGNVATFKFAGVGPAQALDWQGVTFTRLR